MTEADGEPGPEDWGWGYNLVYLGSLLDWIVGVGGTLTLQVLSLGKVPLGCLGSP